jgi:hypothetical protein
LIQSRTISKIHYTITSPLRGSRDGVVSAKEKDEETSYDPTSASPKRGGTTKEHFTNFYLLF